MERGDRESDREERVLRRPRGGVHLQGRSQAIVCGIETHVCVSQTVHDLLEQGIEVHVPADAVGSRHGSTTSAALSGWSARVRS